MKKRFPLLLILLILACTSVKKENANKQTLIAVDSMFSKLSEEKGMKAAFLAYADDDVVKPNPGQLPIIGKAALAKSFEGEKEDFILTWHPVKAEISASGDLGYTFGNWQLILKAKPDSVATHYGNYVSIWKKQNDGSWKYVLDTGNSTPKPAN